MWGNSRRTTGDVRPWAPRRSVAALALLMGPFVVLSVVLKSSRIAALPDPHPAWPLLIASDLLFSLGWMLLWVGALLLVGRSWLRHPIFLVAQVGTLLLAAVTLAHHLVTVRTGSVMAWERAVAVLSSLIALGHDEEFAMHVRAARRNGLTDEEIVEVILQSAIYAGLPAANTAFRIASEILGEDPAEA